MSVWRAYGEVSIAGEHNEFIFSVNRPGGVSPATVRDQIVREHAAIEWARQELNNYLDLPMLGATNEEQHRASLEKVATLRDVLKIADQTSAE